MAEPSPFAIGERIRQLRTQRSPRMTQLALAERAGVSVDLVSKLEQGAKQTASLPSLKAIATALDVDLAALLSDPSRPAAPPPRPAAAVDPGIDPVEVARLAERTDVGAGTLDTIDAIVDRLARDYSREPAGWLLPKVNDRLARVVRLLDERARLDEHRRLLVAAEASRTVAHRLGVQAEHPEIVAWTLELRAWWALVAQRFREAIDFARAGQAAAPQRSSAMAQLAVQEARTWARLGDRRETTAALRRAAVTLAALPTPAHPEHHLVFDGSKLHFYAATCYAFLGMPDPAEEHAREVIYQCSDGRWRGRLSSSHVDLALARVHRGEVDGAAEAGLRALTMFETPSPGTLWRSSDLHRALRPHRDVAEVADWRERYALSRRAAQRALPSPAG